MIKVDYVSGIQHRLDWRNILRRHENPRAKRRDSDRENDAQ